MATEQEASKLTMARLRTRGFKKCDLAVNAESWDPVNFKSVLSTYTWAEKFIAVLLWKGLCHKEIENVAVAAIYSLFRRWMR